MAWNDIFKQGGALAYQPSNGQYAQPQQSQGGGLLDWFGEGDNMAMLGSGLMGAGNAMINAPQGNGFQDAAYGLAGLAGGVDTQRKKTQQEAMFTELAGGDPRKLAFLKANPETATQLMMQQEFAAPKAPEYVDVYNTTTQRLEKVAKANLDPRIHQPASAAPAQGGMDPKKSAFARWQIQNPMGNPAEFERIWAQQSTPNEGTRMPGKDIINEEQDLVKKFETSIEDPMGRISAYESAEAIFDDPSGASGVIAPDGVPATSIKNSDGSTLAQISPEVFQNPNAAGDVALVFQFMKSLDPRSTVREGEFQMAAGIGGAASRVQAFFSEIAKQGQLLPEQRRDLMAQMRNQYNLSKTKVNSSFDRARKGIGRYKMYGLSPEAIQPPNIYQPRIDPSAFSRGVPKKTIQDRLPLLPGGK